MDGGPFHIGLCTIKAGHSLACEDHLCGAGMVPQNTQCVIITGLDAFSITNTMHHIVSFLTWYNTKRHSISVW